GGAQGGGLPRCRVRDRDGRGGERAAVCGAVVGGDSDGDRVALVAVAGGREVERGGGGAGDGGAVLLPLVAVGDGVAIGVQGRGRRGERLVGGRRGGRYGDAGDDRRG